MDEKDFAMRLATLRTKKNVSAREMSLSIGHACRRLARNT